jgi:hypothetical protein
MAQILLEAIRGGKTMEALMKQETVVSDAIEKALVKGDLSALSAQERMNYYGKVCESLGLNPLTKPFEYIELNGKLTLYPRKDATDQLRKVNQISLSITGRERMGDVYIVTAKAKTPDGREEESTGVVSLVKEDGTWETAKSGKKYFKGNGNFAELRSDDLANAIMKAETKAKRRVTLSICGLGMTDESELETIPARAKRFPQTMGEEDPKNLSEEDLETAFLENAKKQGHVPFAIQQKFEAQLQRLQGIAPDLVDKWNSADRNTWKPETWVKMLSKIDQQLIDLMAGKVGTEAKPIDEEAEKKAVRKAIVAEWNRRNFHDIARKNNVIKYFGEHSDGILENIESLDALTEFLESEKTQPF